MEKICWWHLCHHQSREFPKPHKLHRSEHPVHSREPRPDGSIPFLDILITPGIDGSLTTTVFRKPTHTDLYMQWDSHHAISSKYSVIGTLHHRSNHHMLKPWTVAKVLTKCKYPAWALNRVKIKMKTLAHKNKQKNKSCNIGHQQQPYPYIVMLYYKGLSESLNRTCKKYGVQVHFKGGNTIKSLMMAPMDKDPLMKKSGVIYRYKCDRVECEL